MPVPSTYNRKQYDEITLSSGEKPLFPNCLYQEMSQNPIPEADGQTEQFISGSRFPPDSHQDLDC